ncbi:MAG: hypothetical protein ABI640_18255 [Gammaproteobacteria bacterium]
MATNETETIREAVGIFFDAEHLRDAINHLLAAGFKNEELGLLASEQIVRESLGDLYTRTNEDLDLAGAPSIAFVGKESTGGAAQPLGGSLFFVGTSGVIGAVVASSAILGGALLAAVSGAVGVGLVGLLVSTIIHQTDAAYLQEQVEKGHILLFVRMADSNREQQVLDILSGHCGVEVKMHEMPVKHEPKVALIPESDLPETPTTVFSAGNRGGRVATIVG